MSQFWKPIKIGGGGYVTGIDAAGDTLVCRTDTFGGYVWEAAEGRWRQILTQAATRGVSYWPDFNRGITELRVAPTRPSRLYMIFMGDFWRSEDKGYTWKKLGVNWDATSEASANSTPRFMGQKMAVDPYNPDVVYAGTPSSGVYRTFNAGETWALISTGEIPACSTAFSGVNPGHPGICFDPSSGTTNGRTNTIYIPVYGTGVYQSTDAGGSWSDITGAGPTTIRHARCASDGVYYAATGNATVANSLYKYDSGWTNISPGSRSVEGVECDPSDAARIVAFYDNGVPRASADRGSNWGTFLDSNDDITRVSPDIPWLATAREQFMSPGDMAFFDGELWFAHGIGVCRTTHEDDPSSITWTYYSNGIENLTSNCCVVPPNGTPLAASWDRPIFRVENPEQYQSWHGPYRTFTAADIDTSADTINLPNHGLASNTNTIIGSIGGSPPAPLENFTPYYVIVVDENNIKLSATSGPGSAVNLTDAGTGSHTLYYDQIRMAWHLDWASFDPTFSAYIASWAVPDPQEAYIQYSDDDGVTWYKTPSYPGDGGTSDSGIDGPGSSDKTGGCIACSTPDNMIVVPSNDSQPYCTTDGGDTWTEILIDGVPRWLDATYTSGSPVVTVSDTSDLQINDTFTSVSGVIAAGRINSIDSGTQVTLNVNASSSTTNKLRMSPGWGWAYYNKHICVAADRVAANTFYLYNYLRQAIYRSTDGGATWSAKLNTGNIDTTAVVTAKLIAVSGQEGHLLLSSGKSGNPGDANPAGGRLWRSTDGGETWVDVGTIGSVTIREPYCVGVGKAAPGQSYPSIAFVGWLGGVFSTWRTDDEFATWQNIGLSEWPDTPVYIDGSKEIYGTWYVTMGGSSFVYRTEAMQKGRLR